MSEGPLLQVRDVGVTYFSEKGAVEALSGVSLDVSENSFVSVIGPSGCGKSTFLKVVSKVLRPTTGSLHVWGVDLTEADLTGALSYVFQRPLLLPWRTALGNVLLPLEVLHDGANRAEHEEKARDVLQLTGLDDFRDKLPHELSGGMQQRVSLARALVVEPKLLLMDEPFGALDEITREAMQEELLRIWERTRNTILFITHNIQEAVLLSDQVVVMSKRPGRVLKIENIEFDRPRDESLRDASRYHEMVHDIRELLRPEG